MIKYFGTDGVRGLANEELTPELAFKLGRASGYVLTKNADLEEGEQARVIIGRDTRISGEMLESALVAGLLSVGVDVMKCGIIPTPGIAYLTVTQNADAGIMISASHNPAEDNGIKFFGPDGYKLSDEQEAEIEDLLHNEDDFPRPSAKGLGVIDEFPEAANKYISFLHSTISRDVSNLTVCIDAANGATSPLVNQLFADLDTNFFTMGDRPNGVNINDGVGSTHPEALQAFVLEKEADLGLAFDGDGDRVIAVDNNGKIVDGDLILYVIGKRMMEKGTLANDTIVSTVMSNIGFYKAVEAAGIQSIQAQVGDRYVVQAMVEGDHNLGGEQSGHIILRDYNTTGDGLLTGIQLLKVMSETGKSLADLAGEVNIYPQKLVNIKVRDKHTVMDEPAVQEIIAKVEAQMHGDGRILVRPSGTEPILRVMAEASTQDRVDQYVDQIAEVIREVRGVE